MNNVASGSSIVQDSTATAASTSSDGTVSGAASGIGTLTIGQFGFNPVGVPLFDAADSLGLRAAYFDASISPGNTFTSVQIVDCNLNGGDRVRWWNPSLGTHGGWQDVSNQSAPTGDPPCVTITVDENSQPSLSQLVGTEFGAGCPDGDKDGLTDCDEVNVYQSDPNIADTDADGCGDGHEVGLSLNPADPWDFYSVPVPALFAAPSPTNDFRDNLVGGADAQAVFAYAKKGAKTGTTEYEQDLNLNGVKDGIENDRSVAGPGMSGPPDGVITGTDAQLAFAQAKRGYHC
jgi:hypothetical protein